MNLLIVEDEEVQSQMYKDIIDSYNKNSNTNLTPTIFSNLADAKKALLTPDYDAAIIDLKLSASEELEGLQLVEDILDNLRFPVFIVSGSIGQIEKEENLLFKKRSRDGDFKEVLKELKSIYDTGITHILGKKGTINDYLNKIFWGHLSNSMEIWISDSSRTPEQKQKSLLRYTLLHIQEYLELTEDSDFEAYHTAEIYITPPIKNKVFTGDIVNEKITNSKFIVLTPSCDLAQSKAKDILLAEIETEERGLLFEKVGILKKSKASEDVLENTKKELNALICNNYSNKYHFLPKYGKLAAGLINFQKLKSIRIKEFDEQFQRVASINNTFSKDIIARFSYYYSRQGSPDFNLEEVYQQILE